MTTTSQSKQETSSKQICRFYATKKGCRAGESCPYKHEIDQPVPTEGGQVLSNGRRYQATVVDRSKIVPKPRPQVDDARTFQLGQIRRRFAPEETSTDAGDFFTIRMVPSDPDFPFDLEALTCILEVPKSWPDRGKPSLRVTNKEIPRGFQINVERGFTTIAKSAPDATLLGLMNRLDRQLETILAGEMAETIKIVANKSSKPAAKPIETPVQVDPIKPAAAKPTLPSEAEKEAARKKRGNDIRQMEARFGRVQGYARAKDGFTFTLPLDSPKRSTWPMSIQKLRSFDLLVPELYPIDPPSIMLHVDSDEARRVEKAFVQKAMTQNNSTLTQLVNLLTIQLKDMSEAVANDQPIEPTMISEPHAMASEVVPPTAVETDKPHVLVIPRPPEWEFVGSGSSDDDTDSDLGVESLESEDEQESSEAAPAQTASTIERGILLSFPNLELHGVELMEIVSLGITVKCERCKDQLDIERLRNSSGDGAPPRLDRCKKCANPFTITFRADLIHANSVRGGYLDLEGCSVVDMLISSFQPTCSECSTAYPAPGIMSVRGESAMAICRECHRKMTFRIPEVKFLQVSAAAVRASRMPGRRKAKENLGIVAGTELPRRGRCSHYSKSYRWFRFSCCGKVFACDRCHDESTDHPNEHANRMLCGYCSREQNYRPEDCGICHAVLIGKKGHGFWEGGKGTRDKARMSKKDPRKFKRIGGSALAKKA